MKNLNEKISGWYPELKTRVEMLVECGVKVTFMSQKMGVSNSILADWLAGRRGLSHENAPKVEKMIEEIKEKISEI